MERFAEIKTFKNVLEFPESMKGKWHEHFGNDHPITLELACGKGEYALGLGRMYPERNFIGVDIKGNRIWRGAKTAISEGLDNVAFVRAQIDKLDLYFDKDEVAEIWITFPDPQLKGARHRKRLTHPKFLRIYQKMLREQGVVNLKTDSPDLYQFTKTVIEMYQLELLKDEDNVYDNSEIDAELQIKTHYEGLDIAQSNRIHYLQFAMDKILPKEKDLALKKLFVNQSEEKADA